MPKAKLDHAFCLTAGCEDGKKKTDYYDEAVTGFVLECRASGGKTFYLRYDQDGRQKQIKLAAYGDAPFAQVKKKAEKLRSEVVLGDDPAAKKAQARAVPLYAELAAMHLADAKLHQRSYETTAMYIRRHILPRWGKVRVLSCPLLSGPSTMTVWIEEGTTNACEEAQARGDHRQAA